MLNHYTLTELQVSLEAIVDCSDPTAIALTNHALCHPTDWRVPQALSGAAIDSGCEAVLVPSCTRLGSNLVVFQERLRSASRIEITSQRNPELFIHTE